MKRKIPARAVNSPRAGASVKCSRIGFSLSARQMRRGRGGATQRIQSCRPKAGRSNTLPDWDGPRMMWASSTDHVCTCSRSGSVLVDGRSAEAAQYLNADPSVPRTMSPSVPPAASVAVHLRWRRSRPCLASARAGRPPMVSEQEVRCIQARDVEVTVEMNPEDPAPGESGEVNPDTGVVFMDRHDGYHVGVT